MRKIGRILLLLAFCLAAISLAANAQDKKKTKPAKSAATKKAPPKDDPQADPEESAEESLDKEEPEGEEPAPDAKEESASEGDSTASDEPAGDEPSKPKGKSTKSANSEESGEGDEGEEIDMKTISYAIGVAMARNMAPNLVDVDVDELLRGLSSGLKGEKLDISAEDLPKYMASYQKRLQERADREAEEAKKEGETYLANFKKEKGVKQSKTGLLYRVVSKGDGAINPKTGDLVVAHYKGTFIDGSPFDSSYDRNKPIDFEVDAPDQMIAGMNEAIKLMKEGDKYEVALPASLAYGEFGRPGNPGIPPNTVLVFELELIKIEAGAGEEAPVPPEESGEAEGGQ